MNAHLIAPPRRRPLAQNDRGGQARIVTLKGSDELEKYCIARKRRIAVLSTVRREFNMAK